MTPTVVPLAPEREKFKAEVIEILEMTLAEAREGKVIAVGVALVRPDWAYQVRHSGSDCAAASLGAATALVHSLLQSRK